VLWETEPCRRQLLCPVWIAVPVFGPGRLKVWRDSTEVNLTVPPGYLGFLYEDWNPARKGIYESITKGDLVGAQRLAEAAERDDSLAPVQALIVKILLIPNRSSAARKMSAPHCCPICWVFTQRFT
jgi:hypothetical protein